MRFCKGKLFWDGCSYSWDQRIFGQSINSLDDEPECYVQNEENITGVTVNKVAKCFKLNFFSNHVTHKMPDFSIYGKIQKWYLRVFFLRKIIPIKTQLDVITLSVTSTRFLF